MTDQTEQTDPFVTPKAPASVKGSSAPHDVWSWISGTAAVFSGATVILLLLGYGVALAVENRYGVARSSLFAGTVDLLELSSIAIVMFFEAFGRSFNGMWWQVYRQNWPVVGLLLAGWLFISFVFWRKRVRPHTPGPVSSSLNKVTEWVSAHLFWMKTALFAGIIVVSPLIAVAVVLIALMVLVVPVLVVLMGMNAADMYLRLYVEEPVACSAVSLHAVNAANPTPPTPVAKQPTPTGNLATCVVLEGDDGKEIARGRLVVSTTQATVLVLRSGVAKRYDSSGLTQYAIGEL